MNDKGRIAFAALFLVCGGGIFTFFSQSDLRVADGVARPASQATLLDPGSGSSSGKDIGAIVPATLEKGVEIQLKVRQPESPDASAGSGKRLLLR